ncbi:MAG: hypothetical protein RL094_256 [Candidatus Parcubacteria bacterium]|jgi:HAD superfamily hydrolase (TIGR01484 family)
MDTQNFSLYKVIAFDLDNTLAPSKLIIDKEMEELLAALLAKTKVAVISGGSFAQFEKELLDPLSCFDLFKNLHIFPTDGTAYYTYAKHEWTPVYQESLTQQQKEKIMNAFQEVLGKLPSLYVSSQMLYGALVEDRDSQITFSGLGQQAPLEIKRSWDPDGKVRSAMKQLLQPMLPEFSITIAGTTSIDVTPKDHDKAYAISKICSYLNVTKEEILFIGDALFLGGNDAPVISTGVQTMAVRGPNETKLIIKKMLSTL